MHISSYSRNRFWFALPGQTSLEELPSGDFAVDSFFDITYQIDFEGCPGSMLEGMMGVTTATVRLVQGFGAQTIYAGDDLFDCPPDSNTYFDFNTYPLPADFFYPGSDPFDQMTILEGDPLETNPADMLSPTSVIIRRLDDAHFDSCGDSDTIQTEIVALSLVGVSPITVTGMDPDQQWQVSLCLSSIVQQDIGSMAVYLDCDSGGVFDGQLRVIPKLMFDQIDPPYEHREWDFWLCS